MTDTTDDSPNQSPPDNSSNQHSLVELPDQPPSDEPSNRAPSGEPPNQPPSGDNSDVLDVLARGMAVKALGESHRVRSSAIGKRLNSWYVLLFVLLVAFFIFFFGFPKCFERSSHHIANGFIQLGAKTEQISVMQIWFLYYSSKLGIIAIFLVPIIWSMKRISRLQDVRHYHASKEAHANTLEALVKMGLPGLPDTWVESAVKEIFAPAPAKKTSCKDKETIEFSAILKEAKDTFSELKDLIRPEKNDAK